MLAQLALATLTDRAKAQHAERKGFAFQNPPTSHMRKFETPASKITNNTRSILETGNDAISGGISLLVSRQKLNGQPKCTDCIQELSPVICLADGRRRDCDRLRHAHQPSDVAKSR